MDFKNEEKPILNLEFSIDGENFHEIIDINPKKSETFQTNILMLFQGLNNVLTKFEEKENLVKSKIYFRLDALEFKEKNEQLFNDAKKKFSKLTQKEIKLLCFLSRGYKQNSISYIFSIALNTLHSHRKSIYRKMNFENKTELITWCDRYLLKLFKNG